MTPMNSLMQSQIFFFISSIGFILLGILAAIILVYCIRTLHIFMRLLEKIEGNVSNISEDITALIADVRESVVFRFFFKPRRKKSINKQ